MLDQLEERLDLIYKLKRKYGSNIVEILEYCRKIQGEMEQLEKSEEIASKLQKELKELDTALYSKACEISSERHNAAGIIEKHITDELEDLEMKKTQFKVNIEFDSSQTNGFERNYNAGGLDKVEFLISTNPGEPLKPLAKIASGGEMSRIMLAVKTILADVDEIPTLIFDEIDIGISGKAAQKVAEKLSLISSSHQVICVTHSAQIACMADNHFLIEKNTYEMTNSNITAKTVKPVFSLFVKSILSPL
jgi:DNA repair protein RecN (Recombination protein N)